MNEESNLVILPDGTVNPKLVRDELPTYQFWYHFFDAAAAEFPELKGKVEKIKRRMYHDYIQSDEWREKADFFKKLYQYRCQLCDRHQDEIMLHAHHRTYKNIGREEFGDVIVLCAKCHAKFHNKA